MEVRDLADDPGAGFRGCGRCVWIGDRLPPLGDPTIISHTTWAVVVVTTLGLALSFTPARRLEQVGASRVGYLALYLMLTAIGAQADLKMVVEAPLFLAVGVIWLAIHIAVLLHCRASRARSVVLRRDREHGKCRRGCFGADRGIGLPTVPGAGGRPHGGRGIPDRNLRGPGVRVAVVSRRRDLGGRACPTPEIMVG